MKEPNCYIEFCQEPVCTYIDVDGGYTITCLIHAKSDYSRNISEEKITHAAYHYMYLYLNTIEELRDLKSNAFLWMGTKQ